jgi:ATP-dependent RNA helicase DeaD
MSNKLFTDFPISEETKRAVADMGFVTPSPIQAEAIPYLLEGSDVIGQAQTGTGKTAAFGIPLVEALDPSLQAVQALVMCPTRELAVQVSDELRRIAAHKPFVRIATIFGGDSYERQFRALRDANVVVGTPGRIIDHLERGKLLLENLHMAVLDEADEMLNMGFREDMENILGRAPEERQTVLFSATMSREILALTNRFQRKPRIVKVTREELTNVNIRQAYFEVVQYGKLEAMCRLVDFHGLKLCLVFCNQKAKVDEVVEELHARGYSAEGLHGDMRQQVRSSVMARFRNGQINMLVATDVAARGIDVENVDAVFNYDLPMDTEYYVHRIGRTGRAGRSGWALAFVTGPREFGKLRNISNYIKAPIEKGLVPTYQEVMQARLKRFADQVAEVANAGGLEMYDDLISQLRVTGLGAGQIVAALVKMHYGHWENSFSNEDLNLYPFGKKDRKKPVREDSGSYEGRFERPERETRERSSAPTRFPGEARTGDEDMVRLVINIGRHEKVTPSHIVGAMAGETGIAGHEIGHISIDQNLTYVDVPQSKVAQVLKGMTGTKIKGRPIKVAVTGKR